MSQNPNMDIARLAGATVTNPGGTKQWKLGIVEVQTIEEASHYMATAVVVNPEHSLLVKLALADPPKTWPYPACALKTVEEFLTGSGEWRPSNGKYHKAFNLLSPGGPSANQTRAFTKTLLKHLLRATDDDAVLIMTPTHAGGLFISEASEGRTSWQAWLGSISPFKEMEK